MGAIQFARVCVITESAFQKKHARNSSTTSSLRKQKDWGWASLSCVQLLNRMPARSQARMSRTVARGSILLFRQALYLYEDPSEQHRLRGGRRRVGAKRSGATAPLRRIQKRGF